MTIRELLVSLGVKTDTGPVRKFDRALGGAKATMGAAAGVARSLTTSLLGLAAGYVGLQAAQGAVSNIISSNVEYEKLNATLETIEGSAEGASAAFERIKRLTSSTPFQINQVTDAYIKLKALGLDPSEEAIRSYGNTSSALGKDLNQMVEAVADAATGEFERLKEFGIKSKQEGNKVKFTFQGVTTTVKKNAKDIQAYLLAIGNTQFAGAMDRQMDTLGGRFSNLKDTLWSLAIAVGEGGLNDAIRDITSALIAALGEGTGVAEKLGTFLGDGLRRGAAFLQQVLPLLPKVFELLGGISSTMLPLLLSTVKELAPLVLGLVGQVKDAASRLLPVVMGALSKLLPAVLGLAQSLVGALGPIFARLVPLLSGLVDKVAPVIADVLGTIGKVLERIVGTLLPPILQAFEKGAPILGSAVETLLPLVAELISGVVDVLAPIIVQLMNLLSEQWRELAPILVETVAMVLRLVASLVTMLKPFLELIATNSKAFSKLTTVFLKTALLAIGVIVKLLGAFLPPIVKLLGFAADIVNELFSGVGKVAFPMLDALTAILEPIATLIGFVIEGLAKIAEFSVGSLLNPLGPIGEAVGIPGYDDMYNMVLGEANGGPGMGKRFGEMMRVPGQSAGPLMANGIAGGRPNPSYNVSGVNVHISGSANMSDAKVREAMGDAGKELAKGMYVQLDGWKEDRDEELRQSLMQIEANWKEK